MKALQTLQRYLRTGREVLVENIAYPYLSGMRKVLDVAPGAVCLGYPTDNNDFRSSHIGNKTGGSWITYPPPGAVRILPSPDYGWEIYDPDWGTLWMRVRPILAAGKATG